MNLLHCNVCGALTSAEESVVLQPRDYRVGEDCELPDGSIRVCLNCARQLKADYEADTAEERLR